MPSQGAYDRLERGSVRPPKRAHAVNAPAYTRGMRVPAILALDRARRIVPGAAVTRSRLRRSTRTTGRSRRGSDRRHEPRAAIPPGVPRDLPVHRRAVAHQPCRRHGVRREDGEGNRRGHRRPPPVRELTASPRRGISGRSRTGRRRITAGRSTISAGTWRRASRCSRLSGCVTRLGRRWRRGAGSRCRMVRSLSSGRLSGSAGLRRARWMAASWLGGSMCRGSTSG